MTTATAQCPTCQQRSGAWTVRRLCMNGRDDVIERAIQCLSCGTVVTETFLRVAQVVTEGVAR